MTPRAPDITRDQLHQAARQVAAGLGCRLVILFGSAARGQAPEDLDLGVLGDTILDTVDVTNRFIRALGVQAVDVADLRRADPLLLMLAARDGLALYERSPGEFARFASLAARRYADTRKFRDAERNEVRDFIARSGTVR
jgi:predicted nucleotidyltransferase